jgi:hypothetical protein
MLSGSVRFYFESKQGFLFSAMLSSKLASLNHN